MTTWFAPVQYRRGPAIAITVGFVACDGRGKWALAMRANEPARHIAGTLDLDRTIESFEEGLRKNYCPVHLGKKHPKGAEAALDGLQQAYRYVSFRVGMATPAEEKLPPAALVDLLLEHNH
jgi:hypothetical protein